MYNKQSFRCVVMLFLFKCHSHANYLCESRYITNFELRPTTGQLYRMLILYENVYFRCATIIQMCLFVRTYLYDLSSNPINQLMLYHMMGLKQFEPPIKVKADNRPSFRSNGLVNI